MNRVETAEFAKLLGVSQSEDGSWLGDICVPLELSGKAAFAISVSQETCHHVVRPMAGISLRDGRFEWEKEISLASG